MESRMNGSWFVSFEGMIAEHVRAGKMVHATVTASYGSNPFEHLISDPSVLSPTETIEALAILSKIPHSIVFSAGIRHPDGREENLRTQIFDPRMRLSMTLGQARRGNSTLIDSENNRGIFS